jgi:hypothetical protein
VEAPVPAVPRSVVLAPDQPVPTAAFAVTDPDRVTVHDVAKGQSTVV